MTATGPTPMPDLPTKTQLVKILNQALLCDEEEGAVHLRPVARISEEDPNVILLGDPDQDDSYSVQLHLEVLSKGLAQV